MRSPGAGGCFLATTNEPSVTLWTAEALPSVIVLTRLPPELAHPRFMPRPLSLDPILAADGDDYVIQRLGVEMRVHLDSGGVDPTAVLLPFDGLFEVRVAAALRLWRALNGRRPGPNPAALSEARRNRLVLALRALDGRLDGATHRAIATAIVPLASCVSGWP
jgi:Uncharacterized conserved protein (DUF2285)